MTTHIVKTPSGIEFHVDAPSHLSDEDIIGHVHNTINGLPTPEKGIMVAGGYGVPGGLIMTPREAAALEGATTPQVAPVQQGYTPPAQTMSYEQAQEATRQHNLQLEEERRQAEEAKKNQPRPTVFTD